MYSEVFASRLKKIRDESGFTQIEVSKETGISQSIIAYLETGKREPNLENLGILSNFYNVNINWLLGMTEQKELRK